MPDRIETLKIAMLYYREIFQNSTDGMAIIDPQGIILQQNAAHRELLGIRMKN